MNCSSLSPPARKNSERSSKSSNSFSRIGMMWPGTFSRISGFSREPKRPRPAVGAGGSIERWNIPKPGGVSYFCLARRHIRVLHHRAVFRLEREPGVRPAQDAALDRVGVPSGGGECVRCRPRAIARAAVDDDRLRLVEGLRLTLEVGEGDVACAGDVTGGVLDVGADVDDLAAGVDDLLGLGGRYLWHRGAGYSVTGKWGPLVQLDERMREPSSHSGFHRDGRCWIGE